MSINITPTTANKVMVRMPNGRRAMIPFEKLSRADRAFVVQESKRQGVEFLPIRSREPNPHTTISRVGRDSPRVREILWQAVLEHRDQAYELLSSHITAEPNDAQRHNLAGIVYWHFGDFGKAFAQFSEAVSLDDNLAIAYRNRGDLVVEMPRTEKGRAVLEEAKRGYLEKSSV